MKNKLGFIILNIIYILIAINIILIESLSPTILRYFLCSIIFVDSIILIIKSLEENKKLKDKNYIISMIGIISSIIVATNVIKMYNLYIIAFSIWMIILGANRIINSLKYKKELKPYWILILIYGVAEVFLGGILVFEPFAGVYFNKVLGAFVMGAAIVEIMENIIIYKEEKKNDN